VGEAEASAAGCAGLHEVNTATAAAEAAASAREEDLFIDDRKGFLRMGLKAKPVEF
jgi:hypothetical protein